MARPIKRAKAIVKARPAETATPSLFAVLTTIMVAAGEDPQKAAAVAGVVAAVAPAVISKIVDWYRKRGQTKIATLPPV